MNKDSNIKGSIFQMKHLSENNFQGKETPKPPKLFNLIESGQIQNLKLFIEKDRPSTQLLNEGIIYLLKQYSKENHNFYEILNLLLLKGASVNIPITIYQGNISIKIEENVTLLMFGIIYNDINLVKLVLNFNPNIDKVDCYGKNAIIYSIFFDHNDSTEILNLLIKHKANINYSLQIKSNYAQLHSVLTLACLKNLIRIVKCLLDNNVDTNFRVQPEGDTCLHIAVKNEYLTLVGLLLSYQKINTEIKNNQGKRAVDLIKKDENEQTIRNFFNDYYNKFKNMNMGNFSELYNMKGNNNFTTQPNQINQYNQILQMNKKNLSINNKIGILSNDSRNNQFNKNQNNNLQNFSNNNDNDDSSEESVEDEKKHNNIESLNQNNYIKNNNNKNYSNNKFDNKNIKYNNIKKNINKQFNKNLMINSEPKNTNNNSINYNQQKISHININKINLLKNSFNNRKLNKQRIRYDMQIPVEFIKNSRYNKPKNLDNFIRQNDAPVLNLDLTNNKILQLELKILELKEQLKEKNRIFPENILQAKIDELDNEINERIKEKENKEKEKNYYIDKCEQNKNLIKDLNDKQKELLDKIPPDKLCKKSNKNISYIEYLKLKFKQSDSDLIRIYKILHKDLMDYMKYISNIIYRKKPLIELIVNQIKLIVDKISPDYQLKIYGSYGTGLCLPWSNLNLMLMNKNKNNNLKEDNITNIETTSQSQNNNSEIKDLNNEGDHIINNKQERDLLSKLYYILENCNWVNKLKINQYENINTLCLITSEEYGKMSINITCESENNNGLKVLELVKSFIQEYPVLKPLTLALSTILKRASLNNPENGGLPSYGLILMIVSFIQNQNGTNNNSLHKEYIVGKTFYEFLFHYGINFDFDKYVIFTYKVNDKNNNSDEKDNSLIIGQNEKELIIVDPLNNKNNVAKSSYQSKNAKMSFMIALMTTTEECECGCHYGKAFYENDFKLPERSYLKRMFNSVNRFSET